MSKRTRLHPCRLLGCAAIPMLAVSVATNAQVTRAELVESGIDAFFNLEIDRARDFFVAAVNPVNQPPDSIWAVGVQYLVQMHIEAGNSDLADTWMRWAVRLEPDMQVDERTFLPEVIRRFRDAQYLVGTGTEEDQLAETTWIWPNLGSREVSGVLRVGPSLLSVPVDVNIGGRGSINSGGDMTLQPGTYSMQVVAEGYHGIDVTREVLPGVTSVLNFNLQPVIVAPEVEARVDVLPENVDANTRNQLAFFSVTRFRTDPTCGTGVFAGPDGLLLTTYAAIRGAEALELELADGTSISDDVRVAAWDTERNVAVLKLPISSTDFIPLESEVGDSVWTWAFSHPGCGAAATERLQVVSWRDRPDGLLLLSDSLEHGEQGGPLIVQSGAVIGLALGDLEAVPADRVAQTLETARRNVTEGRLVAVETVAQRENHRFGSVMIQSTFSDATAHVTPFENWHWPDIERGGPVPFLYSGPMGRYRLDLNAAGQESHRTEFTIDPGIFKELTEPQIVAADGGGGGFPWPIAVLGAAGAAVAGILVAVGGDPGPENGPDPQERGSVVVILPQRR